MNVGIIAVHTEVSAIFGSRSEVAYNRRVDGQQRLLIVCAVGARVNLRLRPSGLHRNAVAMIVLSKKLSRTALECGGGGGEGEIFLHGLRLQGCHA